MKYGAGNILFIFRNDPEKFSQTVALRDLPEIHWQEAPTTISFWKTWYFYIKLYSLINMWFLIKIFGRPISSNFFSRIQTRWNIKTMIFRKVNFDEKKLTDLIFCWPGLVWYVFGSLWKSLFVRSHSPCSTFKYKKSVSPVRLTRLESLVSWIWTPVG